MADWLSSMQQTFEYYIVDPKTWKDIELIDTVKSSTIQRDSEAETLGSATIDMTESVGESYIRIYLITIQNGLRERHPLGTFLVQTPSLNFNGRLQNISASVGHGRIDFLRLRVTGYVNQRISLNGCQLQRVIFLIDRQNHYDISQISGAIL